MVAIHQFVPTLAPRDAVGGHYMRVRTTLRAAGYTSDIYAMDARGELSKEAKPFQTFSGGRNGRADVALLPLVDRLADRRVRRGATGAAHRRLPQHHARDVLRPLGTVARGVPPRGAAPTAPARAEHARSVSPTPRTTRASSTSSGSAAPVSCRSCSTATDLHVEIDEADARTARRRNAPTVRRRGCSSDRSGRTRRSTTS